MEDENEGLACDWWGVCLDGWVGGTREVEERFRGSRCVSCFYLLWTVARTMETSQLLLANTSVVMSVTRLSTLATATTNRYATAFH
jgi:hypothetical protein